LDNLTRPQAMAPAILIPPAPERRRQPWHLKRTWLVGLPVGLAAFLLAIAPPLPEAPRVSAPVVSDGGALPFRYQPDHSTYAVDFDPRRVRIDLFEGWDREQQAYADRAALAFVSGPMYERYPAANGGEITVPLGDLKFGERVWRGRNRTAARQRAYVAIGRDGGVEFGFGELSAERQRQRRFEIFIGGLHSLYNDLEPTPASYRGAYSLSMGQQIRYYLPRIRMVYGLRPDGRLEVLMSRDGLTLEQTRALARSRGLRAAYLPDHASKSRLIVPGSKGFSASDANWISGGASSFVHVPYMLRLSRRGTPLQGSLQVGLTVDSTTRACSQPLACGQTLAGQLLDRLLAGFNRWMEEGVEPVARLFWAPRLRGHQRQGQHAPLREAPISADPLALQSRQRQEERRVSTAADRPAAPLELPKNDTLPAPELLPPLPPDAGPASLRSAPASAITANEAAPPEGLNAPGLEAPPAEGAAPAAANAPPPPPANPPAANLPALQPPN
jgi:hypothetical protein